MGQLELRIGMAAFASWAQNADVRRLGHFRCPSEAAAADE
jgi:hypothetical protein